MSLKDDLAAILAKLDSGALTEDQVAAALGQPVPEPAPEPEPDNLDKALRDVIAGLRLDGTHDQLDQLVAFADRVRALPAPAEPATGQVEPAPVEPAPVEPATGEVYPAPAA